MNRSPEATVFSMSREMVTFFASVRGAGAAAPTITPTTPSTTSAIQTMTTADNFAASTARSGTGAYTITLKDGCPIVLAIEPHVWGVDGKRAQVVDYNPSTRVMSVQVYAAGGAAADLATTDNLRLTLHCRLST